jgi:DNA-directed RNA polymerase specialized sigma24 family protein
VDHAQQSQFRTTAWDLVRRARDRGTADGHQALDELCRTYWYPLYAYLRRRGQSKDDAADAVQGFFATILHRDGVARVERSLGRFRSWLLTSLQNYLSDDRRRREAIKRGGDRQLLSLDVERAESRYQLEPYDDVDAETLYARRWAHDVLERAREALRAEYLRRGNGALFEALQSELTDGTPAEEVDGTSLGLSPLALRVARHRLRVRFGERIRAEARATLGEGLEPDEEIQELMAALVSEVGR